MRGHFLSFLLEQTLICACQDPFERIGLLALAAAVMFTLPVYNEIRRHLTPKCAVKLYHVNMFLFGPPGSEECLPTPMAFSCRFFR